MKRGQTLVVVSVVASALVMTENIGAEENPKEASAPPHWVLEAYAKKMSVPRKDVVFEQTDLNGDGIPDWVIYSSSSCGSAGCTADVYAFIGKSYCYVGTTRFGDAPQALRKRYHNLKCETHSVKLKDPL